MKKLLSVIFVLLFVASFAVVGCKKEEPATDGASGVKASADASAQNAVQAKEIAKDDRFIAYDNDTVLDKTTKLIWAAKDNGSDINWTNAKKYCENYRGGGYTDWRMPTEAELTALYNAALTYKADCGYDVHLTKFIHLTCIFVWASNTFDSEASNVYLGADYDAQLSLVKQSTVKNYRVLPVCSGK